MNTETELLQTVSTITTIINSGRFDMLTGHVTEDARISRGDAGEPVSLADCLQWLENWKSEAECGCLILKRARAMGPDTVIAEWVLASAPTGTGEIDSRQQMIAAAFAALISFDTEGFVTGAEFRGDSAALQASPAADESGALERSALERMVESYTTAWCSGDPEAVASHYAQDGFIIINGGTPSAGRKGLAVMAGGFMAAFPDMILTSDSLIADGNRAVWNWTLRGTNTGPGGTGNSVCISGFEIWKINDDCEIAESYGYFDSAAYLEQVENGV